MDKNGVLLRKALISGRNQIHQIAATVLLRLKVKRRGLFINTVLRTSGWLRRRNRIKID